MVKNANNKMLISPNRRRLLKIGGAAMLSTPFVSRAHSPCLTRNHQLTLETCTVFRRPFCISQPPDLNKTNKTKNKTNKTNKANKENKTNKLNKTNKTNKANIGQDSTQRDGHTCQVKSFKNNLKPQILKKIKHVVTPGV